MNPSASQQADPSSFSVRLKRRYWNGRAALRPAALARGWARWRERLGLAVMACGTRLEVWQALLDSAVGGLLARPVRERRLLYLAWLFPPAVSGGVYRPTALFKHGAARDWECKVLAGPIPAVASEAGEHLRAQIPASVDVRHLEDRRYPKRHPWLPVIDGGMPNALEVYRLGVRRWRDQPPALVVATGPPFHTFLSAALLARRFGARLVLDYRDEWSESPFEWVSHHPENRRWEAFCLRRADRVVFTTRSQLEHLLACFPGLDRDRCRVLPNGWDPGDLPAPGEFAGGPGDGRDPGPIVLAFVGHFGSLGLPDDFLADLAAVLAEDPALRARFRFQVVGQKTGQAVQALERFAWPECLELVDQVPKPEACRRMAQASGLLLLNPPQLARYIPGKLFEYLATGTPILFYGEGGEVGSILAACKAGMLVPPGDRTRLGQVLATLATQRGRSGETEAWLARHTREGITADMLALFDQVVDGRPPSSA